MTLATLTIEHQRVCRSLLRREQFEALNEFLGRIYLNSLIRHLTGQATNEASDRCRILVQCYAAELCDEPYQSSSADDQWVTECLDSIQPALSEAA